MDLETHGDMQRRARAAAENAVARNKRNMRVAGTLLAVGVPTMALGCALIWWPLAIVWCAVVALTAAALIGW